MERSRGKVAGKNKKEINRRINIFSFVAATGVFGTGLILFFEFHVGHGAWNETFMGVGKSVWLDIHRVAAIAFAAGSILHIKLHWERLLNVARRFVKGRSARLRMMHLQQILLLVITIIVIGTGFCAWVLLSGPAYEGTELRHRWIDVHNIGSLLLLAGLTAHIKRRWRRMFGLRGSVPTLLRNVN